MLSFVNDCREIAREVLPNRPDFSSAYQINNGLCETAACGNAIAYDSKRGLIFAEYMTGEQCMYGESTGAVELVIFPPAQPWNTRRIHIDKIPNASRGFLCNAIYLIGDARVRIIYTRDRGEELGSYYKDYDFLTDTLSDRGTMLLRTDRGDVNLENSTYAALLADWGYDCPSGCAPIVNKVTRYGGELYTALTLDGPGYPVLCRIEGDVFVPFALLPEVGRYEFRYYRDDKGIYGVNRSAIDDTGTGKIGYFVSRDGGKTWTKALFEDGIQSRPDILDYYGKPLVIYNYKSVQSHENFPPMHHHRNSVKFIYDGSVLMDIYSKYGIVEHETVSICGDLYMVFSDAAQALMHQNGACWQEDGLQVENGKEKSNWVKIGYLLARGEQA